LKNLKLNWAILIAIVVFILSPIRDNYYKGHPMLMTWNYWLHWAIEWFGGIFIISGIAYIVATYFYFGYSKAKKKSEQKFIEENNKLIEEINFLNKTIAKQEEDELVEKEYCWSWNKSALQVFDNIKKNGNVLNQDILKELFRLCQEAEISPLDAKNEIRKKLIQNGKLPIT